MTKLAEGAKDLPKLRGLRAFAASRGNVPPRQGVRGRIPTVRFIRGTSFRRVVRLLALLLLALSLAASAIAQDNTTAGNETNETGANETAPEAPAAAAGPLELVIEAHTEGSGGYFTLEGETAKNPRIRVAPGQEVRVTLRGTDNGVHNFCVGDSRSCTEYVSAPGDVQTFTFTAPESGTVEYFCAPHKGAGMRGSVAVAAAGDDGGEAPAEEGTITGDTIDLGQHDPACEGKVAPAIVEEGIVGAPTLQDYIDACKPQAEGQTKAKHAADLVIPISWGLIGLGVVGVVWVHKYYKP